MTEARSYVDNNGGLCESCNESATRDQAQQSYPVLLGGGMGWGTMWLCPKCLAEHRVRDEEKKKAVIEEQIANDELRNRSRALPPVRVIHPHVHQTKDNDSPIIEGSNVPVRRLFAWHRQGTILRRCCAVIQNSVRPASSTPWPSPTTTSISSRPISTASARGSPYRGPWSAHVRSVGSFTIDALSLLITQSVLGSNRYARSIPIRIRQRSRSWRPIEKGTPMADLPPNEVHEAEDIPGTWVASYTTYNLVTQGRNRTEAIVLLLDASRLMLEHLNPSQAAKNGL